MPVIDLGAVLPGLVGLSSAVITLIGSVAGVGVPWSAVLSEVAVLLWDTVFIVSKALMSVLLTIVRSGMLEVVINFGIDLLLILVLEIAMPMLFVSVDLLMCAIDLFFQRLGRAAAVRAEPRAPPHPPPAATRRPPRGPGRCIDNHCFEASPTRSPDPDRVHQRSSGVGALQVHPFGHNKQQRGKQYGLSTLPGLDWVDTPAPTLTGAVCAECCLQGAQNTPGGF